MLIGSCAARYDIATDWIIMGQDITQGHIREIYKEPPEITEDFSENEELLPESGEEGEELSEKSPESEGKIADEIDPEKAAFLHEQVKKGKGIRAWWKGLRHVVIGVVTGAIACIVFYAMAPWAEETFGKKEEVNIPKDEVTEITEEPVAVTEEEEIEEPVELDIENVKQYSEALRNVADDVNRCMATVTGKGNMMGWLDGTYVDPGSASGLIVAETEDRVLILVPSEVIQGAAELEVTFADGCTHTGTVISCDNNTQLGIIAVQILDITDVTMSYIKVAELGNSYTAKKGMDIIILGSPFGYSGGEVFGTLTGKNGTSDIRDGNFQLLLTNTAGADNASGVVFNTSGEVLGFITPDALSSDSDILAAIPISDIKSEIELLSNGAGVPYVGIRGQDIDASTAEEQGLAQGIFITDVEVDSPAMLGGLQTGDIIKAVDNKEVLTFNSLRSLLLDSTPGTVCKVSIVRLGAEGYSPVSLNITLGTK